MLVFDVRGKNNLMYPLTKEIYENPLVVYHGTQSIFASMIENKGWVYPLSKGHPVTTIELSYRE